MKNPQLKIWNLKAVETALRNRRNSSTAYTIRQVLDLLSSNWDTAMTPEEIQLKFAEALNNATDELAEALADFDACISPDEEAYEAMRRHVEEAQKHLLPLLQVKNHA